MDEEKQQIFWKEMAECPAPLILLSTEKPGRHQNGRPEWLPIHLQNPSFEERKQIWEHYLKPYEIPQAEQVRLASKFLFLPGQIRDAVRFYESSLQIQGEDKPSLYEACFAQMNHQLYERATKINSSYSWNQLILPETQKQLLHDICAQMENKYMVYEKWGFGKTVAYGKGVTVIFAGPPGTGKTMAAQILSKELNLEMFKIDLSQMVSKYVGETEKNLAAIFHEAEISNAILFFDEADSLFGARTEVKSSNDRYANLETSYLLQRLEEYEGMTVLATNYLKNIDEAFMRRMKYIIQFQFPDAATRQQIWKVTMPEAAPVSPDLDYAFLGENLELAGGSIKNIAVYAAFMAADRHCEIGMQEILKAARYEMQKTGKILLGKDLRHYGYLLEEN
ncbi:MAG: ATP-binding protein [Hungatella sp.]